MLGLGEGEQFPLMMYSELIHLQVSYFRVGSSLKPMTVSNKENQRGVGCSESLCGLHMIFNLMRYFLPFGALDIYSVVSKTVYT